MRLQMMEFTLQPEEPDADLMAAGLESNTWAAIKPFENYNAFKIWISKDLLRQGPEIIRETIVHEMIHCYHRDLTELWHDVTQDNEEISDQEKREWHIQYTRAIERFVGSMASFLQHFAPEWPGDKNYQIDRVYYDKG